jgi:hypothetical protein
VLFTREDRTANRHGVWRRIGRFGRAVLRTRAAEGPVARAHDDLFLGVESEARRGATFKCTIPTLGGQATRPPGSSRQAGGERPSDRPLGGPPKKFRLGEGRVPKGEPYSTVELPKSRKLLSIVVGAKGE